MQSTGELIIVAVTLAAIMWLVALPTSWLSPRLSSRRQRWEFRAVSAVFFSLISALAVIVDNGTSLLVLLIGVVTAATLTTKAVITRHKVNATRKRFEADNPFADHPAQNG